MYIPCQPSVSVRRVLCPGILPPSSTPSVLGASVVAPLQASVFSALSRTSSASTSLTSTDVQNSSPQIVTNSSSSNLIVDSASDRWIKCSVASCYTVFFWMATASRSTLCSDGEIHSENEFCRKRVGPNAQTKFYGTTFARAL